MIWGWSWPVFSEEWWLGVSFWTMPMSSQIIPSFATWRKTKALRFQVSFVNSSRGSTANRRSGRRAGRSEVDEVATCLRGLEGENHGFLNVFCKFFLTQIHWIEHQTHSTVKCWKNMFEVTTWTTAISSSDRKIILFAGCDFTGIFDELNS